MRTARYIGHAARVNAMVFVNVGGMRMLVSGDASGSVRAWPLPHAEAAMRGKKTPRFSSGSVYGARQVGGSGEAEATISTSTIICNTFAHGVSSLAWYEPMQQLWVAGDRGDNSVHVLSWAPHPTNAAGTWSLTGVVQVGAHVAHVTPYHGHMLVATARGRVALYAVPTSSTPPRTTRPSASLPVAASSGLPPCIPPGHGMAPSLPPATAPPAQADAPVLVLPHFDPARPRSRQQVTCVAHSGHWVCSASQGGVVCVFALRWGDPLPTERWVSRGEEPVPAAGSPNTAPPESTSYPYGYSRRPPPPTTLSGSRRVQWRRTRDAEAESRETGGVATAVQHCMVSWSRVATLGSRMDKRLGHCAPVNTLAITSSCADGKSATYVASGGVDREVIVWKLPEGTAMQRLTQHRDAVWSLSFSFDGMWLLSASADCTVRVWCVGIVTGSAERHESTGDTADADPLVCHDACVRVLEMHTSDVYVVAVLWAAWVVASVDVEVHAEGVMYSCCTPCRRCVQFDPSGTALATCSTDTSLSLCRF